VNWIISGLTIALLVLIVILTQLTCDDLWRDQLTKSGHAEYFLDANNQRQWRMKEIK